ncbi:DUF3040 domain-containing protein [Streptomyces poonensis]|uniref:DUF3040 domain-containing protein n=1 Tax=Streptomyces poonensis TaxID=68255 RepID=A0A918Q409_9ACTN|nr:DUF3040 domain-containing protein [Streptomyces poonensis]GGZ32489.1 hypothetical protein GCM10010365_61640 [Streptomyces poonensis]GLJ92833.1 hypothetical protein GCM10017589_54430 [Streptomyces poonensis]
MTIGRLPHHEQRILDEMEAELRRDRRLDRQLRTLRLKRRRSLLAPVAAYRPHPVTVAFCLAVSIVLMVTGIRTSEPGVIWAFALMWPVTLYAVFRLLCRWSEPAERRREAE